MNEKMARLHLAKAKLLIKQEKFEEAEIEISIGAIFVEQCWIDIIKNEEYKKILKVIRSIN